MHDATALSVLYSVVQQQVSAVACYYKCMRLCTTTHIHCAAHIDALRTLALTYQLSNLTAVTHLLTAVCMHVCTFACSGVWRK
jgi:hypothetical protein